MNFQPVNAGKVKDGDPSNLAVKNPFFIEVILSFLPFQAKARTDLGANTRTSVALATSPVSSRVCAWIVDDRTR